MYMPYLDSSTPSSNMLTTFSGYVHKTSIADGQFFDEKNIHALDYPLAATRRHRGEMRFKLNGEYCDTVCGICAKDRLIVAFEQDENANVSVVDGADAAALPEQIVIEQDNSQKYTVIDANNGDGYIYHIYEEAEPILSAINFNGTKNVNKVLAVNNTAGTTYNNFAVLNKKPSVIPASKAEPTVYTEGYNDKLYIPWDHPAISYNGKLLVGIGYNKERCCGDNILLPLLPKDSLTIYGGCITSKKVQDALMKCGGEAWVTGASSERSSAASAYGTAKIWFGTEGGSIVAGPYCIRKKDIDSEYVLNNKDITRRVYFTDPDDPGEDLAHVIRYRGFTLASINMVMYVEVGYIQGYSCDAQSTVIQQAKPVEEAAIYTDVEVTGFEDMDPADREKMIASMKGQKVTYPQAVTQTQSRAPTTSDSGSVGDVWEARIESGTTVTTSYYELKSIESGLYNWEQIEQLGEFEYTIQDIFYDEDEETWYMRVPKPHPAIPAGEISSLMLRKLWVGTYNTETQEIESATKICDYIDGEHNLVEMGAYVVIFPEKVQINTAVRSESGKFTEFEYLEKESKLTGATLTAVNYNGVFINCTYISESAPTEPEDGVWWADTSQDPIQAKCYSGATKTWAAAQMYIKVRATRDQLSDWGEYDAFKCDLSAFPAAHPAKGQKYFVVAKAHYCNSLGEDKEESDAQATHYYVMFACPFIQSGGKIENASLTLSRDIPDMDYVCESGNRLWGCKYGQNKDGDFINEIFASKLADAKNFHYFANTSIDSYYASLGEDGPFTGCINYQNNPVFFREEAMHRVYGAYPSQYQVSTNRCYGVKKGSHKSLAVLNEVLYWHSPVGFMAYSGGVPVHVSDDLGGIRYKDVTAGTLENTYYACCRDTKGDITLFTFNDYYQMWCKEDDLDVTTFTPFVDDIYALTADHKLYALCGTKGVDEGIFKFNLTTGDIGYVSPYKKRLLKVTLRIWLGAKANADISIQYDNSGAWQHINQLRPQNKIVTIAVPVMPHRCDHFALKIEGIGDMKLLGLTKFWTEGTDYD